MLQKVNNMAGVKKIPQRICIGCQSVHPKKELVRIVRTPEGEILLDLTGKKSGRGAYICRKPECFAAAVKGHRFAKAFQGPIDPAVLENLRLQLFPSAEAEHEG